MYIYSIFYSSLSNKGGRFANFGRFGSLSVLGKSGIAQKIKNICKKSGFMK